MGAGDSNRQNHPDLAIVDWAAVSRIVGPDALLEYKRGHKGVDNDSLPSAALPRQFGGYGSFSC